MGFIPIDEKLVRVVFEKGQFIEIEEFGVKIRFPTADTLLATKLISLPRRTKDHKKWKDIVDIYALIWYSGTKLRVKIRNTESIISKRCSKGILKNRTCRL